MVIISSKSLLGSNTNHILKAKYTSLVFQLRSVGGSTRHHTLGFAKTSALYDTFTLSMSHLLKTIEDSFNLQIKSYYFAFDLKI